MFNDAFPLSSGCLLRAEANMVIAYRVHEIETKIGAGLIEEVIEVAEAEDKLANIMLEHKV